MKRQSPGRIARETIPWLALGIALVFAILAGAGRIGNRHTAVTETTVASPAVAPAPVKKPPARIPQASRPSTRSTLVSVRATRGECWIEARSRSATGRLLYSRVLAQGRTLLFDNTVWIRFGFSQNVDVRVNGRPHSVPPGTVAVTLGPGRPAA